MNIILYGAAGKLCRAIAECAEGKAAIAAGVIHKSTAEFEFPVYFEPDDIKEKADVIIDCSFHSTAYKLLNYAKENKLPIVIATTGHSSYEIDLIAEAARQLPIFMSSNMSVGVNLLMGLVKTAVATLGKNYDIEIIEAHHNQKRDAPSGTAFMLRDAIGRDIPMHSVRGGGIIGDHEVIFAGRQEVLRLSHSAISRNVFAEGALAAARFIIDKPEGLYNMSNLIMGE